MVAHRQHRHGPLLGHRAPNAVPFANLNVLPSFDDVTPVLKRTPPGSATTSTAPSATKSCGPHDNTGVCQKPVGNSESQTLPIVLGVVIPITVALVIMVVLHRRHVKKLRHEDANDRHKSLDFGMDIVPEAKGGKNGKRGAKGASRVPEMSIADTEKELRRGGRGMSLDMDVSNPYLLPPGLQSSRESLHSLTRSLTNGDDKYRPATFIPNDSPGYSSYPSSIRRSPDDSSSITGSSRRGFNADESSQNLLRNASRMSRSMPPTQRNSATSGDNNNNSGAPPGQDPPAAQRELPSNPRNGGLAPIPTQESRDSTISEGKKADPGLRNSNNYLGAFIRSGASADRSSPQPKDDAGPKETLLPSDPTSNVDSEPKNTGRKSPPAPLITLPNNPRPNQLQAIQGDDAKPINDENDFGTTFRVDPPSPILNPNENTESQGEHNQDRDSVSSRYEQDFDYDVRRLTMGIRPLPPEDPNENPEERANRIRSFYKEYFDDTRPGPVYTQEDYYDYEFDAYDTPIYDPVTGEYVMPSPTYAEPITRRAMTPPPRGPPRFQGAGRHQATMSGGNYLPPGPRAFSSASGRIPGPGRRPMPPKKKLPPPAPLPILPTPHMLKDDSMVLPMDFAPPARAQEKRAGTPDTLRGGFRPFSPGVPVSKTLVSAFDDLAVMPSPHALRKSGTFTALDFAPPPRFKDRDTGSDSGSIRSNRSNRSGMSAAKLHNIRAGAYRLSRIPKDVAGTKDDIMTSLRPQWDMAR